MFIDTSLISRCCRWRHDRLIVYPKT